MGNTKQIDRDRDKEREREREQKKDREKERERERETRRERENIPTALEGGDLKNETYILNMVKVKMQVLESLQLPPPQRVQVRYRSQRPKNVTYIFWVFIANKTNQHT